VHVQPNAGGVTSQGLASAANPADQNTILYYNTENGGPSVPTVEFGSQLDYKTNNGRWRVGRRTTSSVMEVHRASNTASQTIGKFAFKASNDAGTPAEIEYAFLDGLNSTVTAGAEAGTVRIVTKTAGADVAQFLVGDGALLGASPTGSFRGVGSCNAVADYYKNGSNITAREVVTYAASMTPNQRNGASHTITITNGTAFTINNPANSVDGAVVTIILRNTSGGAHGAITWGAGYRMAGALAAIATANSRSIQFIYDGTNWVETFRSAADVAN
jgi:hypothetical protein